MLKTIKGKVIAGTVTMALVAGAGSAFANLDAGDKLQAWYTGQFAASTVTIATQSTTYGNAEKGKFDTEYAGMKTAATNSINTKAGEMKNGTNERVKAVSDAYIADVNSQKDQISSKMKQRFDSLSLIGQGIINAAGEKAVDDSRNELSEYTTAAGTAATEQMTKDINFATATAKSNLEAAIAKAKFDLQEELNAETTDTIAELNRKIDAKIAEIRITITQIKDDFVFAQEQSIANAAATLETQAKSDLDAIVSGIK